MKKEQSKSGFVAIIGRPNVGKSTLMNKIIGQKIAITSNKPQTTRNKIMTVYTSEQGQIVFLDTPGMNRAKNKLGSYMQMAVNSTLKDADVVLWIVEAKEVLGAYDREILEKLDEVHAKKILVINKIDMVPKEKIPTVIQFFERETKMDEIVPVCAMSGLNKEELIQCIFQYLPIGEPYYDEDTITDQPIRQITAEMIREKALHALDEEIPHGIAVMIESMKFDETIVTIEATIVCEKESHKGIIIGKGGQMLKKIGTNARYEIEKLLEQKVNLKLFVKVKKEWRDSEFLLKNFGYNQDDFRIEKR